MWLTRRLPRSLGTSKASSACSGGIGSEPGRPAWLTAWGRSRSSNRGRNRQRPATLVGNCRPFPRDNARTSATSGTTEPSLAYSTGCRVGRCCRVAAKPARRRTRKRYDSLTSKPSCTSAARVSASGEERVSVGGASEVADDGSDGANMEMEPLGELVGGCALAEVSAADLVAALSRGIGPVEQAREFLGASHRC